MKGFIEVNGVYINVNCIAAIEVEGITTIIRTSDGQRYNYYGTLSGLIDMIEEAQ